MEMRRISIFLSLLFFVSGNLPADEIRVLLVDGQNNHKWKETTPVLKRGLELVVSYLPFQGASPRILQFDPCRGLQC